MIADAGHEVLDLGTDRPTRSTTPTRRSRSQAVASGRADRGIIVCGSGAGVSVAACKIQRRPRGHDPRHVHGAPGRRARRRQRALPRRPRDRRGARGRDRRARSCGPRSPTRSATCAGARRSTRSSAPRARSSDRSAERSGCRAEPTDDLSSCATARPSGVSSGQHTSRTDLPLTENGREQGAGSWRERWRCGRSRSCCAARCGGPARRASWPGSPTWRRSDEDLREWDYGEYEGLTTPQIREDAARLEPVARRLPGRRAPDRGRRAGRPGDRAAARAADGDALAFAHGHILRVLTARWLEMESPRARGSSSARRDLRRSGIERETEVAPALEPASHEGERLPIAAHDWTRGPPCPAAIDDRVVSR